MTVIPPNPSPNSYISFPVTVDPNALLLAAIADIQAQIPGWVPRDGHLEVIVLEEAAQMMSTVAAIASQVPMSIFMAFGQLVGVKPLPGTRATVPATITMIDDAGYTIPAGFQVAFPLSGNQRIVFTLQLPLVIPSGDTTGAATFVCETVGSFPNGLPAATTLQLQQTFAQIVSIVTTAVVSGGVDPDTVTTYINRLSEELTLLAPRPILPIDFAEMAQNVEGVFRALAIDGLSPGRSVTDGVLSSGSLIIGSATADFTAADVGRSAAGGTIPAGAQIASVLSTTQAQLNAGHAPTAPATGVDLTFGDLSGQERCVTVCGIQADGTALTTPENSALLAYLEGKREVNFLVFTIDPTYTEIDVSVTCTAQPGADTGTVQAAVAAAITAYLNPATWSGGVLLPPQWNAADVISILEIANVVLTSGGVEFVAMGGIEIAIHGGSLSTADVDLPGDAPLPTAGTILVTVTAP